MAMKLKHKLLFMIIALALFSNGANAQRFQVENLETFQYKPYYFGFLLGFNSMDFMVRPENATYTNDSLFTLTTTPEYGFQIGILANKRINTYLHMRLSTVLAFGERSLNYKIVFADTVVTAIKKIETTFIEFPLALKYSSRRLNNISAYVMGGARYGIDLASQIGKRNKPKTRLSS